MSAKATGLVWDLDCPAQINDVEFKSNHKYVLVAYADHADHHGRSIYPSVKTIAEKTGLDERTVQRMTRDLETMGYLVQDGQGPRGTNRWKLPYNDRGDTLSPLRGDTLPGGAVPGDKNDQSLGDNSSGDNSSGDSLSPEFKEPEHEQLINLYQHTESVWGDTKEQLREHFKRAQYITWIEPTQAGHFDGTTLHVLTSNSAACKWLNDNAQRKAQELLGVYVTFVIAEPEDAEALRS